MDMSITDGFAMLNKAHEREFNSQAWDVWLVKYQHMDEKTFINFTDFIAQIKSKSNNTNKTTTKMTKEQIIEQAEKIRQAHLEMLKKEGGD